MGRGKFSAWAEVAGHVVGGGRAEWRSGLRSRTRARGRAAPGEPQVTVLATAPPPPLQRPAPRGQGAGPPAVEERGTVAKERLGSGMGLRAELS